MDDAYVSLQAMHEHTVPVTQRLSMLKLATFPEATSVMSASAPSSCDCPFDVQNPSLHDISNTSGIMDVADIMLGHLALHGGQTACVMPAQALR
jgi:hypothetical protein